MEADILFLKQGSSILRQSSIPVCGELFGSSDHEPHTGLDDCLRMLLPCFRKRMSGEGEVVMINLSRGDTAETHLAPQTRMEWRAWRLRTPKAATLDLTFA